MTKKIDLSRNIFRGAKLDGFSKAELVMALLNCQHFCPPRPTRQDKETLRKAACAGLLSIAHGPAMAQALRDVRRVSSV